MDEYEYTIRIPNSPIGGVWIDDLEIAAGDCDKLREIYGTQVELIRRRKAGPEVRIY